MFVQRIVSCTMHKRRKSTFDHDMKKLNLFQAISFVLLFCSCTNSTLTSLILLYGPFCLCFCIISTFVLISSIRFLSITDSSIKVFFQMQSKARKVTEERKLPESVELRSKSWYLSKLLERILFDELK